VAAAWRYDLPEMPAEPAAARERDALPHGARQVAITMSSLVALDLVLGVAALFTVPFHRGTVLAPDRGRPEYLAHAVLGLLLAVAAIAIVERARGLERYVRAGAVTGLIGLALAGVGGALAVVQAARLAGMGLMLLGSVGAIAGYVMPLVDADPSAPGASRVAEPGTDGS